VAATIASSADDARITSFNPWWFRQDWPSVDPHLRRLGAHPITFPSPLVDQLDLTSPGLHTLRGPRQVGKSTGLKLLVSRALKEGYTPRHVVYLAFDLLEGQPVTAVARFVERAKELAGSADRSLLLLDEVTVAGRWSTAVKDLWDRGVIDRDIVVCTGSSAVDLAQGTSERLPGRRGRGRDHLVLPQPFDVFARAMDAALPPSPRFTLANLLTDQGHEALQSVQIHGPRLKNALDRYLRFGGLPAAVVEAANGAVQPSEDTQRILWDSLVREVLRKGASEPATRALLERVVRSLGSKTNWSHIARDMDVPLGRGTGRPDHKTMRDYVEFLAIGYFILIVYYWRRDADSSWLTRQKKLYFGDPLLLEVAHELCCPGLAHDIPALVENAVALALYRRYEPQYRQIEGFLNPDDLHVWQSPKGSEVDFVCGPRSAIDVAEVKYQNQIDRRELSAIRRAFPHRPVVLVTKDVLELTADYALVPAHLFLWAIG